MVPSTERGSPIRTGLRSPSLITSLKPSFSNPVFSIIPKFFPSKFASKFISSLKFTNLNATSHRKVKAEFCYDFHLTIFIGRDTTVVHCVQKLSLYWLPEKLLSWIFNKSLHTLYGKYFFSENLIFL